MKKIDKSVLLAIVAALALAAGPASAVSVYDPLTSAATFTDVIAAIMAVAAVVAGLYVSMRGVRTVLAFIRR
jgi:hypothetical protein